jgi:hypothetical protein
MKSKTKICAPLTTSIFKAAETSLRGHPLAQTWRNMISRCCDPKDKAYIYYGATGVRVCLRWLTSFEAFVTDMGQKPTAKHSIDRYPDPYGDYEPSNCRWATAAEQRRNQRARPVLRWI